MKNIYNIIVVACLACLQVAHASDAHRLSLASIRTTPTLFTIAYEHQTIRLSTGEKITRKLRSDHELENSDTPFDTLSTVLPKNLRIKFTATRIANEIVSGGGVATDNGKPGSAGIWVYFANNTSIASAEAHDDNAPLAHLGNYAIPLPGPGEAFELGSYYSIYDALVFDGCGNVPVVPIEFRSMVRDVDNDAQILGEFSTVDNMTLTPNGYWHFNYRINAMDLSGSVSNIDFDGFVEISCTNLESYP